MVGVIGDSVQFSLTKKDCPMSSVIRHRHFVQWSLSCFVVLTLAVMLGCQPGKTEKKVGSQTSRQPANETSAPAGPGSRGAGQAGGEGHARASRSPVEGLAQPPSRRKNRPRNRRRSRPRRLRPWKRRWPPRWPTRRAAGDVESDHGRDRQVDAQARREPGLPRPRIRPA